MGLTQRWPQQLQPLPLLVPVLLLPRGGRQSSGTPAATGSEGRGGIDITETARASLSAAVLQSMAKAGRGGAAAPASLRQLLHRGEHPPGIQQLIVRPFGPNSR